MADLGLIAVRRPGPHRVRRPAYTDSSLTGGPADMYGYITGVLQTRSGFVPGVRVTLHWPRTMECIAHAHTNHLGVYRFDYLLVGAEYSVWCDGPTGYRPLAHSGVIPGP